jgi:hypothetical protein
MLQPYVDWCKQSTSSNNKNFIDFNMSSMDVGRFFITYSSSFALLDGSGNDLRKIENGIATINYSGNPPDGGLYLDQSSKFLQGKGQSLFSDRTGNAGTAGPFHLPVAPFYRFNLAAADNIQLQIDIETGRLTLTLLTWGNAQGTADLRCANGVLYGFFNPPWDGGLMLSLRKAQLKYQKPPA